MEKQISDLSEKKITRKEAIKKTGYMAASTATMMILLNKNAQGKPKTSGHRDNGFGNGIDSAPGNSGPNNNANNGPRQGDYPGNSGSNGNG